MLETDLVDDIGLYGEPADGHPSDQKDEGGPECGRDQDMVRGPITVKGSPIKRLQVS
jgi:hypothetical protein